MSDRSGVGWHGKLVGMCPVQGYGEVDGYPWYFRARGDSWSIQIAEDKELKKDFLPLVGDDYSGWMIEEDYGTWPDAGHMNPETAWVFIEVVIDNFRSNKIPYVAII